MIVLGICVMGLRRIRKGCEKMYNLKISLDEIITHFEEVVEYKQKDSDDAHRAVKAILKELTEKIESKESGFQIQLKINELELYTRDYERVMIEIKTTKEILEYVRRANINNKMVAKKFEKWVSLKLKGRRAEIKMILRWNRHDEKPDVYFQHLLTGKVEENLKDIFKGVDFELESISDRFRKADYDLLVKLIEQDDSLLDVNYENEQDEYKLYKRSK